MEVILWTPIHAALVAKSTFITRAAGACKLGHGTGKKACGQELGPQAALSTPGPGAWGARLPPTLHRLACQPRLSCPRTSSTHTRCPPPPTRGLPCSSRSTSLYRTRPHGFPTAPRTACSPGQPGDALLVPSRGLEQLPAPSSSMRCTTLRQLRISTACSASTAELRRHGCSWLAQAGHSSAPCTHMHAHPPVLLENAPRNPQPAPCQQCPFPWAALWTLCSAGAEGAPSLSPDPQLESQGEGTGTASGTRPGSKPAGPHPCVAAANSTGLGPGSGQLQVGPQSVWLRTEAVLRVGQVWNLPTPSTPQGRRSRGSAGARPPHPPLWEASLR